MVQIIIQELSKEIERAKQNTEYWVEGNNISAYEKPVEISIKTAEIILLHLKKL